jgi:hypothetical protein
MREIKADGFSGMSTSWFPSTRAPNLNMRSDDEPSSFQPNFESLTHHLDLLLRMRASTTIKQLAYHSKRAPEEA